MRLPLHSLLSLMKAAPNPKTHPLTRLGSFAIAKIALLACFDFRRNEADVFDSRTAHDVNSASHSYEFHGIVALYKSRLVGAPFENVLQPRPQTVPRDIVLIDPDLPVRADLNDDSVRWLNRVRRTRCGLRHQGTQSLRRGGRDNHENYDQDEQHINQRNDVRFGHRSFAAPHRHAHEELL